MAAAQQVFMFAVLPRPFQHSGPPCLQYPYFFDVVAKMIDVIINSAQATSTHYALKFSWGEPWCNSTELKAISGPEDTHLCGLLGRHRDGYFPVLRLYTQTAIFVIHVNFDHAWVEQYPVTLIIVN